MSLPNNRLSPICHGLLQNVDRFTYAVVC